VTLQANVGIQGLAVPLPFECSEGENQSMPASVDAEKCSACGECVDACPLDAITIEEDHAVVDDQTCGDCGACVEVCPTESISVS